MEIYILSICLFIFGLVIGSFINVVVLRLPAHQPLTGRSHCPHCKHTLSAWDLVPVLSFVWLRGQCRYCKTKVSPRYLIIELLTGILFASTVFFIDGYSLRSFLLLAKLLLIVSLAEVIFIIDLEHYLILDKVVWTGSLLALVLLLFLDVFTPGFSVSTSLLVKGLLGALTGALFFGTLWYASGGKWIGFGDVKFMIPFGLLLGFPLNLLAILLGCIFGSFIAIPMMIFGSKTLASRVPFGTFLSISLVFTAVFGQVILDWYLRMIGL